MQQLCCSEIFNFINEECEGKLNISSLKLGPDIKPIDIAAIFKLLFDTKYIDNSLPEIEEVIVGLFGLKDNYTIDKYLNNNAQLKPAAKRFCKVVSESALVNRP